MAHSYCAEKSNPGEWITFRANNGRTARVPAGKLAPSPKEEHSIDLGCYEALLELRDGEGGTLVLDGNAPCQEKAAEEIDRRWNRSNDYFDLYGTGELVHFPVSHSYRPVKLFDRPGMQVVETHEVPYAERNVDSENGMTVWDYSSGKKEKLFDVTFPYYIERPQILVADMTGDGVPNIIISGWHGTVVYTREGEYLYGISQATAENWHWCRKRGFVGAFDVNGDGLKELVIIGCLQYHCDMLSNTGKELNVAWFHMYDEDSAGPHMTSIPYSVVDDFDGDGQKEVLLNVWNEYDDHKWHLTVYDATGALKYDLPGIFCHYSEDINGDGTPELFCTHASDRAVPDFGLQDIIALRDGTWTSLFSTDGCWSKARWRTTPDHFVTHSDGIGCMGEIRPITATVNGKRNFFIITETEGHQVITGYTFQDGAFVESGVSISLPQGVTGYLERSGNMDGEERALLVVKAGQIPEGPIDVKGWKAELKAVHRKVNRRTAAPVVADIDGDGVHEILVANQADEVVCLAQDETGELRVKWKHRGLGMSWQYNCYEDYGVSVDDLYGDGNREILIRTVGEKAGALAVLDKDGNELWRREFDDVHGGELNAWLGNVTHFGTADLGRGGRDVVVTVQTGIANRARTYALDRHTGEIIHQVIETSEVFDGYLQKTGAGGFLFSSSNLGNGHDTIACGYGNFVWAMDGESGKLLFEKFMTGLFYHLHTPQNSMFWVQCIVPLAVQQENGEYAYFCSNSNLAAGLLKLDGTMAWTPQDVDIVGREWQCLFDPKGDGNLLVAEVRIVVSEDHRLYLTAYSPLDGVPIPEYTMPLPEISCVNTFANSSRIYLMACDINGDGKDEILFNDDRHVYCVGYASGKAELLWETEKEPDGTMSSAVLASLQAGGDLKLLYSTSDGYLKILG